MSISSAPADPTSWAAVSRLVRRTGFGATGAEVDAAVALGPQRYLAGILAADPSRDAGAMATPVPTFAAISPLPAGADVAARRARNRQISDQIDSLTGWWLRRMVAARMPFGEKLTFCWHNHFATAVSKVRTAPWMAAQNEKLRTLGRGSFRDLAYALLTDAATLFWLDGERNTKGAPNENLSREFMELFALGHGDGYTETDVREGARALTGWRIGAGGTTAVRPQLHDDAAKTLFGATADYDAGSFCDIVLAQPAASKYLVTRTYGQLVSDHAPTVATVSAMTAAYGSGRNLAALLSRMLGSADFTAAAGTQVINPVEWLVGAVRALQVPVADDATARKLLVVLRALGQVPFNPPSVAGWPSGSSFLSTAAADVRMKAAAALVGSADLDQVAATAPAGRLDAVAHLLGVPSWSDRTATALKASVGDPRTLVTVALNAPEYLVQ